MANESIPVPGKDATATVPDPAPSSLAGWASFQRGVNVTLPAALSQASRRLSEGTRLLKS